MTRRALRRVHGVYAWGEGAARTLWERRPHRRPARGQGRVTITWDAAGICRINLRDRP